MKGWLLLFSAGLFEIGFVYFLKLSDGLSRIKPTLALLTFSLLSFYCLSKSIKFIPVSIAYTVWTSIGIIGSVLIGILIFSETFSFTKVTLIFVIAVAVILLIFLS